MVEFFLSLPAELVSFLAAHPAVAPAIAGTGLALTWVAMIAVRRHG